jgi:predicted PurR-regulated permease PerM
MKYILPLLLLSAFLIPFSYTVHAQNQNNKVFQNITGLDKGNSNSTNQSANQSIANDQNKTGQTEQDKAVKNVTQSTNQVAKQASEALNKIGNQVGHAFQNITGLNNEKNISNK